MSNFELLMGGFLNLSAQPIAIFLGIAGLCVGILLGVLPGLTATMGVAILLPFTFGMDPVSALLMISGVFFGVCVKKVSGVCVMKVSGVCVI